MSALKTVRLTALALVAAVLAASPAIAAEVGSVAKVKGEATMTPPKGQKTALTQGTPIALDAAIVTGPDARLEIVFKDDSRLTLGEKANLVVDKFVYDPGKQDGEQALRVTTGAFRFITGGLGKAKPEKVALGTPVATMGIRGTDYWGGQFEGDALQVFVLEGSVEVTTPAGSVVLTPGQGTRIPLSGNAPTTPVIWSQEKIGQAIETISF